MKKKNLEVLAVLSDLKADVAGVLQQLEVQAIQQVQMSEQIVELIRMISDQQGYLNNQIQSNSVSLKSLEAISSFGSQEIFQYVQLIEAARNSAQYSSVFSAADPMISIIIPTHTNPLALWERTIPSIVAQSHTNLEILVVVDGNHPDIFETTLNDSIQCGDHRISVHLAPPTPTEFPELESWSPDQKKRFDWFRSGNGPFNHGMNIATGHWIAPFSHDDAMHPTGYERVLKKAMQMRWEYCYAPIVRLSPTDSSIIHSFPPRSHHFGVQGSLIHSALKMFRYDFRDALVGLPNDYGMIRRMMLCGIRMGTIEEAASDYYPSSLWP